MTRRAGRHTLRALAAILVSLLPVGATAAQVLDCGAWVGADTLMEPWDETTRTFSRGSVRLALVDLGEPECCPQHLAVLIPANMYGGRACFLVARGSLVPNGWVKIGLDEAEASRDATPGMKIRLPVYGVHPLTGGPDRDNRKILNLRIHQAAGSVVLEPNGPQP
ncbi:MAG: hypothetical protein AAGH68_16425 [Pseudomonadota bacterium]